MSRERFEDWEDITHGCARLDAVFAGGNDETNPLMIEYTQTELRLGSARDMYIIPLQSDDKEKAAVRLDHALRHIEKMLHRESVHHVVWRFISASAFGLTTETRGLMVSLVHGKLTTLEVDIATMHNFHYLLGIILSGIDVEEGFPQTMSLRLREGNFSRGQEEIAIANLLPKVMKRSRKLVELHIEIAKMSDLGREAVEQAGAALSSVTVSDLSDPELFGQLVQLVKNTDTHFRVNIEHFDLPDTSIVYLARGNLSLSIKSISKRSMLFLSCEERLEFLSVPRGADERISAPGVDIGELRVEGEESEDKRQRVRANIMSELGRYRHARESKMRYYR